MSESNPTPAAAARELFQKAQQSMLSMFQLAPSADPSQTLEVVGRKLLESQEQAATLMKSFAQTWSDIAARGLSNPESWKPVLDETMRLMEASWAPLVPEAFFQQLRDHGAQMLALSAEWPKTWRGPHTSGTPSFLGVAGETFGGLLTSPGFGLFREQQAQTEAHLEAWLEHQRRDFEYKQVLAKAWSEAFREMTARMAQKAQAGEVFEEPRQLMDMWVEVADGVFTQVFKTEAFSVVQSAMLNSTHQLRKSQRELTESVLRRYDLPTKSDIEEAHRAIYGLRKELRALRKEISALRGREEPVR